MSHQFINAFILSCGNRDDRHAEHDLHQVHIHSSAVAVQLIHHVQRHDYRNIHLEQLHGKVKIPLDVGCVNDIDDGMGLTIYDKIPGDHLLTGIWRHGINTRKVGYKSVRVAANDPILAVNGDSREVADMLIGSGQLIEERSFAAVLIADQSKGQGCALRQRITGTLRVELSLFTETRMSGFLLSC